MKCQNCEEQLLDFKMTPEVKAHLAQCDRCQEFAQITNYISEEIASLPIVSPPENIEYKVISKLKNNPIKALSGIGVVSIAIVLWISKFIPLLLASLFKFIFSMIKIREPVIVLLNSCWTILKFFSPNIPVLSLLVFIFLVSVLTLFSLTELLGKEMKYAQ